MPYMYVQNYPGLDLSSSMYNRQSEIVLLPIQYRRKRERFHQAMIFIRFRHFKGASTSYWYQCLIGQLGKK